MENDELNGRIDFSALDPYTDQARQDMFVARVLDRAALELARRRRIGAGELVWNGGTSVFGILAGWARPALAAAALAVVVSGVALRLTQARAEAGEESGVLEAMNLPTPVQEWLGEERTPTTADLILTLEGDASW
jgi:hypothetical protein